MGEYDAFASTHIRVIAGMIGFIVIIAMTKKWGKVSLALKNPKALWFTLIGGICGPFLGVYLSLYSVQRTSVGIGSTLMAIVPVLIIPLAIILYKEKITVKEIIGAIITASPAS